MRTSIIPPTANRGTPRASLAALGAYLGGHAFFAPIHQQVQIPQKTIDHAPTDKLLDLFITLLAGAHGVSEVNTRLRADPALQAAFGRRACADQSTIQRTLDAVTPANLTQLEQALDDIYRAHSAGCRHDYAACFQVLDIDLTGAPCGPLAEGATRGYFSGRRAVTGRQVGRVVASLYNEVVCTRLYEGSIQLRTALVALVAAAARTLRLTGAQRARTIIRFDAGGGTLANLNALLNAGYHLHGKDYSGVRAATLAGRVREWVRDPAHPSREVGRVRPYRGRYTRPVTQVAVRWRKKNGQWAYGLIVSSLSAAEIVEVTEQAPEVVADPTAVLLTYVRFYDGRGGGAETTFKEDNQGWGVRRRNKKHFAGQAVLEYLGQLAHNAIIWARGWLVAREARLADWGVLRLVRDVWAIAGRVEWSAPGQVRRIVLNQASRLAQQVGMALQALVGPDQTVLELGDP
jgi:hypothetical protein